MFFDKNRMMKKIIIGLVIATSFITNIYSQELTIPAQTQYLADNPFSIAATYAGIGDNAKIRVNGLTQWVGVKDAPNNQSLAADFRIANRSGLGLFLYNDKNGNTRQQGGKIAFAHHIILDKYTERYMSFGLSYNFNQFRIDIDKFDPNIPDPGVYDNRAITNHNFDVSMLYREKSFYANFSIANILNKNVDNFTGIEPIALRTYQVYTGYVWKEDRESDFEIEPSAFFQYYESDGRSSTDLNLKFRFLEHEDYFWAGISYRFLNDQMLKPLNIGPMAGLKKSNFYFAYSYQVTTNTIMSYNSGTHMITLGLDLFQGISDCPCTVSALP